MQYMKFHLKKQFQFIPISPTIAPKGKESIEEEGRMQQEWQKDKKKRMVGWEKSMESCPKHQIHHRPFCTPSRHH